MCKIDAFPGAGGAGQTAPAAVPFRKSEETRMNILGLARHGLNSFEQIAICGVMLTAFISLWYAWMLRGKVVLKKDKGTPKMQEVWNAIRVGADSYLSRSCASHPAHHRPPDGGPVPQRLRRAAQPGGAWPSSARRTRRSSSPSGGRSPSSWAPASRYSSASWACAWPSRPTCGRPRRPGGASTKPCRSPITPGRSRAC